MKIRRFARLGFALAVLLAFVAYALSFVYLRYDSTLTYFDGQPDGAVYFRVVHVVHWSQHDWLNDTRYWAYYPLECIVGEPIDDYPFGKPYDEIRNLDRGEPVFVRNLQSLRELELPGLPPN